MLSTFKFGGLAGGEECVSPTRNFSARNLLDKRRDNKCYEHMAADDDDDFKSAADDTSTQNGEAWNRKSQVTLYKAGRSVYAPQCASGGAGGEVYELSFNNSQHFLLAGTGAPCQMTVNETFESEDNENSDSDGEQP